MTPDADHPAARAEEGDQQTRPEQKEAEQHEIESQTLDENRHEHVGVEHTIQLPQRKQ